MQPCVPFEHSPWLYYSRKPTFPGHEERDLAHLYSTNNGQCPQSPLASYVKRSFGSKSHGIILEKGGPLKEDVKFLPYTCIKKTPHV
jgi:hypothetical protein